MQNIFIRLNDFGAKLNNIIVRPKSFFENMEFSDGYKGPLIFSFLIFLFVTLLGVVLFLLGLPQMVVLGDLEKDINANRLSFLFFMRAVTWGVSLFGISWIYHLCFKLVGGIGNYEATYRIVVYSTATYLFNLIPRVGIFIYCFYSLILVIVGGKIVHKISMQKAIIGPLIPIFVITFISIIVQIFIQNS